MRIGLYISWIPARILRLDRRIKQIASYIGNQTLTLSYGDGVSDININQLLEFHRTHGKLATMTIVKPPSRFGHIELEGDRVKDFAEKPQEGEGWINGGFFVLEPEIVDYIQNDETVWERDPMERLAAQGQLVAFKHEGFWQCMDV